MDDTHEEGQKQSGRTFYKPVSLTLGQRRHYQGLLLGLISGGQAACPGSCYEELRSKTWKRFITSIIHIISGIATYSMYGHHK